MKVVICTLFFAMISGFYIRAQELDWVISMGGSGNEVLSRSTTDVFGNIYSTGRYSGQDSDFDPGLDSFLLSSIVSPVDEWGWHVNSNDIFISKLSSEGSFIWAKSIGGKYDDVSTSLAVNDWGDLFVAGIFQDTIDVNPGSDSFLLNAQTIKDAFVLKLNADGDFEWAKSFFASAGIRFNSILNLESGNLLLAGYFSGLFTIEDINGITHSYSSAGDKDGLILVLDYSGNVISCEVISGDNEVSIQKVIKTAQNQLLFIGNFKGSADFDFSADEQFFSTNSQEAGFILKTESDFTFIWNKVFKGTGILNILDFCFDSEQNIFATGFFKGTADFNPSPNEEYLISSPPTYVSRSFVFKISGAGDFNWAFSLGSGQAISTGRLILSDVDDNLIIAGHFEGQIDFDPGPNQNFMHSVGTNDAYALKVSNSGNFVWHKKISGSNPISLAGIHTSNDNGLLMSGSFVGLYNFNHPNYELQTALGQTDVFILKLSDLTVGVNSESFNLLKLRCWPNPFSTHVFVESSTGNFNNELKVYDTNGKLVYTTLLLDSISKVEIGDWNPGVYFFTINNLSSILIKY
jgi:hypothetical protein